MEQESKNLLIGRIAILLILLISYFIAMIYRSELWCNILSPLNALMAGDILVFSYRKSNRSLRVSKSLILLASGCFAWAIADILWAIVDFRGGDPENNSVIWLFYAITNLMFLISLFYFATLLLKKWDLVQFFIDLVIVGYLTVLSFWIIFVQKDLAVLNDLLSLDYASVFCIISDLLISISIISWFQSIRSGKVPPFLQIISFGLVLFTVVDLCYYFVLYNNIYIPNTLIDFMYMPSLCIVAFGGWLRVYQHSTADELNVVTNKGRETRWLFLLMFPLVTFAISYLGIFDTHIGVIDFFAFAVPIFFYWGSWKYIQISLEKEMILKLQNQILEQKVSEQIDELTFLANQDTLTTLYNRRYFMSYMEDTLRSLGKDSIMAVLLIDLDRFKTINDIYGHNVGDEVLVDLSRRMIEWNRYNATLARLGGDEFAVMFVGKYTQEDIENFCEQIIDLCREPIQVGDTQMNLTMSIGVALATPDVRDGKTLLKNADIAMYHAKLQGYNKYQFYNPSIDKDFKKLIKVEMLLRQVDVEKDFKLFYQPQFSLPDLKLIGAEALIRWENPELGFIPPNVFIPIAEEIDYILKIGTWVIEETISQIQKWNYHYPLQLKIGFNLSPKQFKDRGFVDLLETLISSANLDPAWVDVEITESMMIAEETYVNNIFAQLKKMGVSISIDDFGSGYSALNYLNKYPFDRIKLDKTLIDGLSSEKSNSIAIVQAAINMAHASGIQTIAEGVETKEQLGILIDLGCDQVQGFLLGRPVPPNIFEEKFLNKNFRYNESSQNQ
ncbi:MAG TPA: bifunctional diguanylate cyclase/phosphodiesterase [Flexilinea sp.]|nr:bifunctional diguanylate cyclase/phosphodiesterase [Flexilinea sp.]